MLKQFIIVAFLISLAVCEIYFQDKNFDETWEKRWIQSKAKSDFGKFTIDAGKWNASPDHKGLKTSQDARFYALSSEFQKPFTNEGKDLVIQFTVKHEQGIDCGGGYVKILPEGFDPEKFVGDSKYNIMFGPDICGPTKKVHLIFHYKGKNLQWRKTLPCESDKLTHIYTAIIKPDNTYEVHIDGVKKESGSLYDDWEFLEPKQIPDPNAKKPEDWVDEKEIPDPDDKKPEDWDQPKTIPDPDAKKPEDWNDEEDGVWEPPQIPNPEYKGEWKPRMIPNPKYKGEWKAPMIDNPNYKHDDKLYLQENMKYIGLDLWQVKSGSIFNNFLVTDSIEEAKKEADRILEDLKKEREVFNKMEEERRKKEEEERKRIEEEEKKKREEEEKKKKEEEEKKKKEEEEKKKEEEEKKEEEKKEEPKTEEKKEEDLKKLAEEKAEELKKVEESLEKEKKKDEL